MNLDKPTHAAEWFLHSYVHSLLTNIRLSLDVYHTQISKFRQRVNDFNCSKIRRKASLYVSFTCEDTSLPGSWR